MAEEERESRPSEARGEADGLTPGEPEDNQAQGELTRGKPPPLGRTGPGVGLWTNLLSCDVDEAVQLAKLIVDLSRDCGPATVFVSLAMVRMSLADNGWHLENEKDLDEWVRQHGCWTYCERG